MKDRVDLMKSFGFDEADLDGISSGLVADDLSTAVAKFPQVLILYLELFEFLKLVWNLKQVHIVIDGDWTWFQEWGFIKHNLTFMGISAQLELKLFLVDIRLSYQVDLADFALKEIEEDKLIVADIENRLAVKGLNVL
jgi:hypothetical protein